MPNMTPNYGLKKPLGTESAKIGEINDNFDVIDSALTPTVTDTETPDEHATGGKLALVLSWLCNRLKAVTGKSAWYQPPSVTLEDAAAHMRDGIHTPATQSKAGILSAADKSKLDGASAAALPNSLAMRDAFGRMKAQSPANASDVATKGYVDGLHTARAVKGTYTGDGKNYQYIPLDFAPVRVQVICETQSNTAIYNGMAFAGCPAQTSTYKASELTEESILDGSKYHYVKVLISGNGFYVCYCASSSHARTNAKGYTYHFTAERF